MFSGWQRCGIVLAFVCSLSAAAYTPFPDDPCVPPIPFDPNIPTPLCPPDPVGGDDRPVTAMEMLNLIGQFVDDVEVVQMNACGEVDPYYVGDSCEYTLKFPDGRLVYAWLVGGPYVLSTGLYQIKYLDGQPGAAYARWNVFMVLERKVASPPWPFEETLD